jgi:hypothetical protein
MEQFLGNIVEKLASYQAKIEKLNAFIDIQTNKVALVKELVDCKENSDAAKEAIQEARELISNFHNCIVPEYVQVLKQCQRNQLLMLHLMEKLEEMQPKPVNKNLSLIPGMATPKALQPSTKENLSMSGKMKMSLIEYQKSPFVMKKRQVPLELSDFEAHISREKFEKIPKYMRGRESYEELTAFLDVIIESFTEKYTIMYKKRELFKNPQELEIWKMYNNQQDYFPGKFSLTYQILTGFN